MIYMSFLLSDYSIVWGSQMVGTSNVIAFSLHPIWFYLMMLVRKDEKNTVTMMTFLHLETCGEANSCLHVKITHRLQVSQQKVLI